MSLKPTPARASVLITGCSSGIGRATALRLARSGRWTVWATARRTESIADLAAAGCRILALDVTDDASMRAAVATVEAEDGPVAALVNNAGYQQTGAVESVSMDDLRRQFETNVFGPMRMIQLTAPGMRRLGGGRIVNISSMGGRMTLPGGGAYHGSKHALEALSDALRFELAPFGIKVAVIEPGAIHTGFMDAADASLGEPEDPRDPYAGFHAALRRSYEGMNNGPMARLAGSPDDVAKAIETALTAPRPRPRYKVNVTAWLFIGARRMMSDRMWDRMMSRMFGQAARGA